jgi:hypothetical protein
VSNEQAEFAEFFQASWEPCLRAVVTVGMEVTFNYLDDNHEFHFGVIDTSSYTCSGG